MRSRQQHLASRRRDPRDSRLGRLPVTGIVDRHQRPGRSQPLLAAEYHLRLALSAPDADAAAAARLRAAFNLARGGLRDDARVQFEWLLKNARDPAQIAVARRELGF